MADSEKNKDDGEEVIVPMKLLADMQAQMADMEIRIANADAKNAGLEELFAKEAEANGESTGKLRVKKNFEPKFRTVRLRKYPIAGDVNNMGIVAGWSNRGAYQQVDRTGVSPQIVDMIDIFFLGKERNAKGVLQSEQVKLLDLINNGTQVFCKILETKKENKIEGTGEEIDCTVFDPAHGLISTGEKIDGYITFDEIKYKLEVPGEKEPVWIDCTYVNS